MIYRFGSSEMDLDAQVKMQAVSATPEVAAEIRRRVGDIDVSDILHKVRAPALVMHCAGDAIQSPEQSRLIAGSLPNAEFSLCDSPDHMVVPSDPIRGPCMEAFDRFLADTGTA
mgnify:FL=1